MPIHILGRDIHVLLLISLAWISKQYTKQIPEKSKTSSISKVLNSTKEQSVSHRLSLSLSEYCLELLLIE